MKSSAFSVPVCFQIRVVARLHEAGVFSSFIFFDDFLTSALDTFQSFIFSRSFFSQLISEGFGGFLFRFFVLATEGILLKPLIRPSQWRCQKPVSDNFN